MSFKHLKEFEKARSQTRPQSSRCYSHLKYGDSERMKSVLVKPSKAMMLLTRVRTLTMMNRLAKTLSSTFHYIQRCYTKNMGRIKLPSHTTFRQMSVWWSISLHFRRQPGEVG